jgi:hypothetical protein
MGQAAAFWAMIPGPKMLWQFGEIGFPYSINTCTNGTVNNNCRLDNKPLVWENFGDVSKRALYDVYSNLLRLRQNPSFISTFTGNNYTLDLAGTVKTIQVNTDSLKIVVVGNFDLSAKTANVTFPNSGTWFSYLTKTSLNVSGTSSSISLQPGEYHVYLNRDLSSSVVTALLNPVLPELDLQTIIYPNPVKNELNIKYVLPKSGEVVISLMSANGIKLGNLFKGVQSSGLKNISFPGSTLAGKLKSGGIYYLHIQTNQGQSTVRFLKTL